MHVGIGGFGVGGRPDINGSFGTGPVSSYDWYVILSGSVFFFMWGLNFTVVGFMVGSGGDRQEVRQGFRHRERGHVASGTSRHTL